MSPALSTGPLDAKSLRTLVVKALHTGNVTFSRHAKERMAERDIDAPEVTRVLRQGTYQPDGLSINDEWRYRALARGITVVFSVMVDETGVVVITVFGN